jgi:hypothetical protein
MAVVILVLGALLLLGAGSCDAHVTITDPHVQELCRNLAQQCDTHIRVGQ